MYLFSNIPFITILGIVSTTLMQAYHTQRLAVNYYFDKRPARLRQALFLLMHPFSESVFDKGAKWRSVSSHLLNVGYDVCVLVDGQPYVILARVLFTIRCVVFFGVLWHRFLLKSLRLRGVPRHIRNRFHHPTKSSL